MGSFSGISRSHNWYTRSSSRASTTANSAGMREIPNEEGQSKVDLLQRSLLTPLIKLSGTTPRLHSRPFSIIHSQTLDFGQLFSTLTAMHVARSKSWHLPIRWNDIWESKGNGGGTNFKMVSLPYRRTPSYSTGFSMTYADFFKWLSRPPPPTRTTTGYEPITNTTTNLGE